MALELLALALWIPIGLLGLWLLVTGRRPCFGLPKGFKEGWQLRVLGLAYFLVPVYPIYRVVRDRSYPVDGIILGYAVVIALALAALYRWQKAKRSAAAGSQP